MPETKIKLRKLRPTRRQFLAGTSVLAVPGVGPKTARLLWQKLNVTTLEELKVAAEAAKFGLD